MLKINWKIAFPVAAALIGLYILFSAILFELGPDTKKGLFAFLMLSFIVGTMVATILVVGLIDLASEIKSHEKSRRSRR